MNKEVILYLFFGVLTTAVNFLVYFLVLKLSDNYVFSTTMAFIVAVIFAYVTNKKYVFENVTSSFKKLLDEFFRFVTSRIFTYIIDVLGMILLIEYLSHGEVVSKIAVNIVVVGINYILSKIYIFKKEGI
ncbi:GtrA family protein [uncultured Ilyobacter sp.]|uniref:GtrA family protein n=1 Tax=uncultured Ilyobacter sp. TaxID=544433 RepID=UPI002AA67C72|nr:GtrA family protein [uncultured Ilyobacter sp.]